jgi:predicted ArsR family transcriptional regulator
MGRVWIGLRERVEHLRRLAVVFSSPVRLKIVTELYQRDMSPTQFYKEFGGGSVARVARHFERLRETGWLRHYRSEGPGGARRGGTETIYRATELAFCDRETYTVLPHSLRVAVSWNGFKEIAELCRRAMEERTFQARPDHRLTGTRVLLDQEGWTRVADALAQEFAEQYEEQEDARRRTDRTGDELFRTGSLLLGFELPIADGFQFGPALVTGEELMIPFTVRVSKVFEDEVCLQIMDEANRGEVSVPTFHAKYGEQFDLSKALIRRRFNKLVQYGWLKVVGYKSGGTRRGGTEKFYAATGPALYDEEERGPWAKVPDALARTEDWKTFARLSDWVKAATVAGTLTRHDETCLAWSILHLDQKGWERAVVGLKRLHAFIVKEQELAEVRLRKSGGEPMAIVVALGAFETPEPIKEF